MEITSKLVNALRTETGAGMMDCKKALVEAQGNFDEAKKILRKKGLAAAICKQRSFTKARKSSFRATKSVSQLTSINTPTFPPT